MQKLKRKPLLTPLADTVKSLLGSVRNLRQALLPSPPWLTMVALIVLLILALSVLSGCTRVVRPTLPPEADPRPMPQWNGKTNRQVFGYIPVLREWGKSCEADKAVIRKVYGHE